MRKKYSTNFGTSEINDVKAKAKQQQQQHKQSKKENKNPQQNQQVLNFKNISKKCIRVPGP